MTEPMNKTAIDVHITYKSANNMWRMHSHIFDELLIMESGGSEIITSDGIFHTHAPCVIFYPKYQPHQQIHTPGELYLRYCIMLDSIQISDMVPTDAPLHSFAVVPLDEAEFSELKPYLELMVRADQAEKQGVVKHLAAIVLGELAPLWRRRLSADCKSVSGDQNIRDICC